MLNPMLFISFALFHTLVPNKIKSFQRRKIYKSKEEESQQVSLNECSFDPFMQGWVF